MGVNIIGVGSTVFGEHFDLNIQDLLCKAARDALADAKLASSDIDALFVANCFSGQINGQENIQALAASALGIPKSCAIGGGEAAGAFAIALAADSIRARTNDIILVIGVEKMSDLSQAQTAAMCSQFLDGAESETGASLSSTYAVIARRYLEQNDLMTNHSDEIPVVSHTNALRNNIAQFRIMVTKEKVSTSPLMADPVRVLHSAAPSDGACAIVLCNDAVASNYQRKVKLLGSGIGSDRLAVHEREQITSSAATKRAVEEALLRSGINREDIHFAEVHDSFTIAQILALEDLGFAAPGKGAEFIMQGKIPINTSGGLKGCGHPLAATGVRQAIEAFYQLTDSAGERQVKNAKFGLTQTASGTACSAVVNVFGRG